MSFYIPHFHFNLQRRKIRDQKGLWMTSFFRGMGFSMINIFSFVFIFSLGRDHFLDGGVINGLRFLLTYLIVLFASVSALIIPLARYVIRVIGYRRSIATSLLFSSSALLSYSLADVTQNLSVIYFGAFIQAMGICLYWVTYYTLFADDAQTQSVGKSFGALDAMAKTGQIIAPLLGAWITVEFGFKWLFVFGVVLLLVSAFPMLFLKHHLHFDQVSLSELWRWTKERRYERFILAVGARHIHEKLIHHVWPIYVFLLVGTIEGMGVFRSLVLAAATVCTLLVSKIFDKHSDKRIQVAGVSGHVFVVIGRSLASSLPIVIILDSIDRFFESLSRTFFFGYLFRRARGRESFSFVVYWIFWDTLIFAVCASFLLLIVSFFSVEIFWLTVFVCMGLGAVGSLLIQDHK